MGSVLTRDEQVMLWEALSDVFVDNAIDYISIAGSLKGYERSTIETAFFVNVAPACYSNLQAVMATGTTLNSQPRAPSTRV